MTTSFVNQLYQYAQLVNGSSFDDAIGTEGLEHIEEIVSNLKESYEWRSKFKQARLALSRSGFRICSLGQDCFPRTALTRYGIKPSKKEGELSLPSDLCVTPLNTLRSILDEDFDGFADPETIRDAAGIPTNIYGVGFNHERQIKFLENNYEEPVGIYASRIDNFHHLNQSTHVLYVMRLSRHWDKLIDILEGLIDSLPCTGKTLLCVVSTASEKCNYFTPSISKIGPNLFLCELPQPYFPDFPWHHPAYVFSKQGASYEKAFCRTCISIMKDLSPIRFPSIR